MNAPAIRAYNTAASHTTATQQIAEVGLSYDLATTELEELEEAIGCAEQQ